MPLLVFALTRALLIAGATTASYAFGLWAAGKVLDATLSEEEKERMQQNAVQQKSRIQAMRDYYRPKKS